MHMLEMHSTMDQMNYVSRGTLDGIRGSHDRIQKGLNSSLETKARSCQS